MKILLAIIGAFALVAFAPTVQVRPPPESTLVDNPKDVILPAIEPILVTVMSARHASYQITGYWDYGQARAAPSLGTSSDAIVFGADYRVEAPGPQGPTETVTLITA